MTKYYLVRVDFEYMKDSCGDYTLKKTEAGRLRLKDRARMLDTMKDIGITGQLIPTTYKLGNNEFIEPSVVYFTREHMRKSY